MKRLVIAAALAGTIITGAAVAQDSASMRQQGTSRGAAAADTNADGVVTRAEAMAAADALFARFDANSDGRVSGDERPGKHGQDKADMTREQFRERAAKRFDLADANKDGRIDQSERQEMRGKRGGHRGKAFAQGGRRGGHGMAGMGMMMRADANRDGILTRAEATTAAQAAFDRIDTNRDGRVDQAERDAARQQMKMRRGGDSAATGGVSR